MLHRLGLCIPLAVGIGCQPGGGNPGDGGDHGPPSGDAPANGDFGGSGGAGGGDSRGGDESPSSTFSYGALSLNLRCFKLDGTSYATNTDRFAAIAAAVATEHVAAIAVQEACKTAVDDAIATLEAALETATGEVWSSAWAFSHIAWEGTLDQADEGVGILARGEIDDVASFAYRAQGGLARVGIAATLAADLGGFRLHCVHLDHEDEAVRIKQAREAAALALTEGDPGLQLLIAGDLNAPEATDPHGAFGAFGFRDLTDPIAATRIDHIFAHRGADLNAAGARAIFTGADYAVVSDHPGVLVELSPGTGESVVTTRITAICDVGMGNAIAVRGDTPPLTWDWGWPALPLDANHWRLVLTDLPAAPFELKVLRNDSDWQTGDNVTGNGGADNETTPIF